MTVVEFDVGRESEGERLDRVVAAQVRERGFELSNSKAKRLVEGGDVSIDGREAWKASRSVESGWHIRVVLPEAVVEPEEPEQLDLSDRIIHADEWIVAVDKPAGVPTHATHDPDRDHVRAAVLRWLQGQGEEAPYAGVHHRLDVGTSGVLVFARDRRANKGLADAFSDREAQKTYLALVAAKEPLESAWSVESHIGRDRHQSGRMRSVRAGGDYAHTEFRTLEEVDGFALVEARPHTGRRHQIRVHLGESGAPILGDETYGGPQTACGRSVPRPMLHAWRLTLPHPVEEGELRLEADVPDDLAELGRRCGLGLQLSGDARS
jgi:23S rRNA pseudouridine1911/1915/1917 synthase